MACALLLAATSRCRLAGAEFGDLSSRHGLRPQFAVWAYGNARSPRTLAPDGSLPRACCGISDNFAERVGRLRLHGVYGGDCDRRCTSAVQRFAQSTGTAEGDRLNC